MKRFSVLLAVVLSLVLASGAMAAPAAFTQVTGGIAMSGPSQYESFSAFDYGVTGDRGTVAYTNFEYPASGTGVWNVGGTYLVTFDFGGPYTHRMTISTVTPTSTTSTTFSGTGVYLADPSYTWTVTGIVSGSRISYTIVYISTQAGYTLNATGVIAADGSMSGTWTDSLFRSSTWSTPAGSVHEVLSYTAAVNCAVISGHNATFGYVIPAGFPGLSGLNVVVVVYDGGTPGTNGDTYAHGVAATPCGVATTSNYPIVSGNLVVH